MKGNYLFFKDKSGTKETEYKKDLTKSTYNNFTSVKNHLIEYNPDSRFNDWYESKIID